MNFTLNNRNNLINLFGSKPKFNNRESNIYGILSEFSIKILEESRKRNFNIPDMEFGFRLAVESKEINLTCISNDNFNLYFNSDNIITSFNIPKISFDIFSDYSGPSVKIYSGENWDEEKKSSKSLLNFKSDNFLRYSGYHEVEIDDNSKNYETKQKRKIKLNNILNKNVEFNFNNIPNLKKYLIFDEYNSYKPKDYRHLKYYNTNFLLYDVLTWVYDNVYLKIINTPTPKYIDTDILFKEPDRIPIKNKNLLGIYTKVYDYNHNYLKKYCITPNIRLVNLSIPVIEKSNHIYKDFFHDGYIWCFNKYEESKYNYGTLRIELDLKYANDVYVINNDIQDVLKRAESMININDYNNEYENYQIIVRRYISKEEIKEVRIDK
jgi:hypothetical protein